MIYLDNAATTALSETARKAMEPYFSTYYGNPSSIYRFGQEARKAVEESRQTIASLLHVSPREIYFTGGGTESDNWAISSVALESALKKEKSAQLITSTIEHPAVLRTCSFFESLGVKVSRIPVDKEGFLDLEILEKVLQEESSLREREERSFPSKRGEEAKKGASHCLVSVMAANNEIGTLQNLREIGRLAKEYGAVFHTDAVQAFGQIPLDMEEIPEGKISGVNPLEGGGTEESPESPFLSSLHHRLPGNVHICLPGVEGESVLLLLDQKGICASSGSACASGSLEPSHVLLAIGKSHEEAYSGLRLSLEETLTEEELEYTVRAIKEAVEKLRG